jgi:hypothetical protein
MERRFSMNDFEESLKEHADDFKMIPSKRVWHGIYNDLHPGRRWPSVAMSFLLIFTLVVVGHLNTHTGSQVHNISKDYFSSQNKNLKARALSSNNRSNISNADDFKNASNTTLSQQIIADKLKSESSSSNSNTTNTNHSYIAANTSPKNAQTFNKTVLESANNVNTISQQDNKVKSQQNINIKPTMVESNDYYAELNSQTNISNYNNLKIDYPQKDIDLNNVYTIKPDIQVYKSENILSADKSSSSSSVTDRKVLPNKPQSAQTKNVAKLHHKKNAKISWVFYAAPNVNSVTFSGQPIKPITNLGSPAVAINQKENRIIYNSSLGFEAGTQFNYEISKKLSFTLGLQVTYSGYKIISNQVHPTLSTLMLKDSKTGVIYAKNYLTHYGDGTGLSAVPLRNYSLQASLPLGLQYELFGNKKLQFNAAANFAPSLILKSNAYLLSSDGSNYINDPSLLRKWNMSSNFGLFMTFRSNKLKWQIGPNVRYQWLSTYKPDYTIKEHLIDYGLRIGISK